MPATVLTAPVEFTALKNQVVLIVPTMSSITAPTLAELNAGKNVTRHIPKTGITGFTKTAAVIQSDNLATGLAVSLDDGASLDQSSIQFLQSKSGTTSDIRSVLAEGDDKYVVICTPAEATGSLCTVAHVFVQTISPAFQGGVAKLLTVSFQVNAIAYDVTYPTS